MRLLKAQNTNLRNIYGKGVKYTVEDEAVVDSTYAFRLPRGTGDTLYPPGTPQNQRPLNPVNGQMRYNTTLNEMELYENGAWRNLRYAEPFPIGIIQQTLGYGDANETIFGILDSGEPDFPVPVAPQNVLVLVENVFQIAGTNYGLIQNPARANTISSIISVGATTVIETSTDHGYSADNLVEITNLNASGDIVEGLNTGDSTGPGYCTILSIPAANQIEVDVNTTGGNTGSYPSPSGTLADVRRVSSLDGLAYPEGWYLEFSSAPDIGKPITVLHNFDK